MTSKEHGWEDIIAAAASTAVDLDDQNRTDCRMCWAKTATTEARGCGTPASGFFGEKDLTSLDTADLASDVTGADEHDLSDDLLVWIGEAVSEGGGIELTLSRFVSWAGAADANFLLRWAFLAARDFLPADCDLVDTPTDGYSHTQT